MNIFDRRKNIRKLEKDITKYALRIDRGYHYDSHKFTINIEFDEEVLKDLDFWSIPIQYVSQYTDMSRIECDKVTIASLTIRDDYENNRRIVRTAYEGKCGADLSMFFTEPIYVDMNRPSAWNDTVIYTNSPITGVRDSNTGEELYIRANETITFNNGQHLAVIDTNNLNNRN